MIKSSSSGHTANLQSSINCPRCGSPIQFPIQALLQAKSLTCIHCLLELEIDQQESKQALQKLRKLASSLEKGQ